MLHYVNRHFLALFIFGIFSPFSALNAQSSSETLEAATVTTSASASASATDSGAGQIGLGTDLDQDLVLELPSSGALEGSSSSSAVLSKDIRFSVQLVHSVKFPLTEDRCYYQFFVDAKGSDALAEVRFDLEMALEGRIVGSTSALVTELDGTRLSKRIREFAFDGPCRLDGVRVVAATGGYQPRGAQYTLPVDLIQRNAVSTTDFEPLEIALGTTALLPGAPDIEDDAGSKNGNMQRVCIKQVSNLRTGPGTEFNIITVLQPGIEAFIERRTSDGTWNRIRTQFGRQGWVYYTLVWGCPN